jgi:RNA polymerase sigma-70 factor (ECF subfamily)
MDDDREPPDPKDPSGPAEPPRTETAPPDFLELHRRFYKDTVSFLGSMGFDRETARDLAQETFLRVYQSMGGIRTQSYWSFIRKIALRLGLNKIRDDNAEIRGPGTESLDGLEAPKEAATRNLFSGLSSRSGEDDAALRETKDRLRKAIRRLPENHQSILRRRIRGDPYNKIAAELGLSVETVKSSLRDARKTLRDLLKEEPTGVAWQEDDDDREG